MVFLGFKPEIDPGTPLDRREVWRAREAWPPLPNDGRASGSFLFEEAPWTLRIPGLKGLGN